MAVLFWLSSLSGSSVPGRYASVGHFLLYATLGALVYAAAYRDGRAAAVIAVAVIFSSLYGVTDEFHQSFVPGRMPDVVDWGVDTLGACVGATAMWLLTRKRDVT